MKRKRKEGPARDIRFTCPECGTITSDTKCPLDKAMPPPWCPLCERARAQELEDSFRPEEDEPEEDLV
jgi:hypothetical protein